MRPKPKRRREDEGRMSLGSKKEEKQDRDEGNGGGDAERVEGVEGGGGGEEEEEEEEVEEKGGGEERRGEGKKAWALGGEDLMAHILGFLTTHKDRNAASLVCKAWNAMEASARKEVYVGNCYAISAERVTQRFANLRSLILKGKPRFADFDFVPRDWGAFVDPWIGALSRSHPFLEELRLKRMTLSDESLGLAASSFPGLKVLSLTSCDGFSTDGLASITADCRHLTHLELTENALDKVSGTWLSAFSPHCTSLVSLDFKDLDHKLDFEALESLIDRCTGLETLKLSSAVSLTQLKILVSKLPRLVELGVGSFSPAVAVEDQASLSACLAKCTRLRSLSGFWGITPGYLSIIYPISPNLVSLNLSYSPICDGELADLVSHCHNLRKLWVMDTVEDKGLQAVGASCKELRDFRVYPGSKGGEAGQGVTEEGLAYIAQGCPELRSILYFCGQMTNAAVEAMAKGCPSLLSFRLCIMEPSRPDHTTREPMDEGFGAIVRSCASLRRLSLSGLLTDRAFEYIGMYAKSLERLSVAFAGESDAGLQHVLRGCPCLKKLEVRDSPFGDMGLLSGLHRLESMRSLWMSNCRVSLAGCHWLARHKPRLNVEVIQIAGPDRSMLVESLYVYRSVAGKRGDCPPFVLAF